MAKPKKNSSTRRGFLKGAAAGVAAGAAALVTDISIAEAQQGAARTEAAPIVVPPPMQAQIDRDAGNVRPPAAARAVKNPGSDLMVQVLRDLGVEFVASNPGSSFEGVQESIINYGNPPNVNPEFITALHEMSAVDMAHGYGKAEGKPMVAMLHGTLGIQNAAMAIYQAYYDRTPMVLLVGRDEGFIQAHTAHDMAAMCRSFTKWDATGKTLVESLAAIQRAYAEAMAPPQGPTLVVLDMEHQKEEVQGVRVPAYRPPQITGLDATRVRAIAKGLIDAQNPRIAVGRLRTHQGVKLAVELAESVGATTTTAATNGPMSFPQRHPLCGPGASTTYDFVLGLEAPGAQYSLTGPGLATLLSRDTMQVGFGGIAPPPPGATGRAAAGRGNAGANDIEIDAEASLKGIIEEVALQLTADKRRVIGERAAKHAAANQEARMKALNDAVQVRRNGWNGSPIATARIYAELWPLIMNEDWCLASPTGFSGGHNAALWDHNKPYSYLGSQGAAGMGYGLGASVGAALAAKVRGRIVINIQCDGDFNYSPGAIWTAAHHRLPMLTIMHNNRAWHQEFMFVEYMTGVRGRGTDRGHIGTTLRDPDIDYAKLAQGYGMAAEGPITDPSKLLAALKRGVDSVKRGAPYLIDVITQPR